MAKQTYNNWKIPEPLDDMPLDLSVTRDERPVSRVASVLEKVGGLALLLAALCAFALFMSWLEFGAWNDVLTWGSMGVAALIAIGVALVITATRVQRRAEQVHQP